MTETTTTEHGPLEWYLAALAGSNPITHESEPRCGYFKRRLHKGGPWVPAAIWHDENGTMVCAVNGHKRDPQDEWTWLCGQPVPYDDYQHHIKNGHWPNTDETLIENGTGSNQGPADDSPEGIEDQINSALAGVEKYAEITDDETAATAQTLRDRLLTLRGMADKTRETAVRPHLDAQKEINGIWQPLVKAAKAGADAIRTSLTAHENRKLKVEQEQRRKAEEAQRKAEEEQRKKEAEAEKAGKPAPEPASAPEPEPAPEPKTQIKGGVGRAASVTMVKVAHVEDQDAAYTFMKEHKELAELIQKLAQRAVDAGYEVPGVRVDEERKVR